MARRTYVPLAAIAVALCLMACGCSKVDDDRIPAMPVSINLADAGLWNVYGVSGTGIWRIFVKELGEPSGFHYQANTYTGFGGVLLFGGIDPTDGTPVPLAYDLACPVECRRDVRVFIDTDSKLEAVCPECGSHYDVMTGNGMPVSGEAKKRNFGLTRYQCMPGQLGGYMIRD